MSIDAVSTKDREILRRLAEKIAKIAADPVMEERRRLWKKLNALEAERPMILTEAMGIVDKEMPFRNLQCEDEWARGIEFQLRDRIFLSEEVGDDYVMEPRVTCGHVVRSTGYGVDIPSHRSENADTMGSYVWDAPIKNLPDDIEKLHFRQFTLDKEATEQNRLRMEDVFGDILKVENRGNYWWTMGLTWSCITLIGLQELMMFMYDQPEGLHALMAFLRDDHMQALDWYEQNGVLTPNNEDDYIGSGGRGYTDLLPQPDYIPGQPARIKDLWGLSESQETVGVGAELFSEFIFPYQVPVISRFGFACYGCCEPVHGRWHIIKQIPNLRRVSVSPWADVELMAEYLGKDYVYSRKPNPALISTPKWDEDAIRADLMKTVTATKGLNLELVMKDVHTLSNETWRLRRWTEIAREVIDEVYS